MGFNSLTWGVKASFRSYVEAAGGSTVLSDGATRGKDGSFVKQKASEVASAYYRLRSAFALNKQ